MRYLSLILVLSLWPAISRAQVDRHKYPSVLERERFKEMPQDSEIQKLQKAIHNERLDIMTSSYLIFLGGWENQCRPSLDSARAFRSAAEVFVVDPKERKKLLEQLLDYHVQVANEVSLREANYQRMGKHAFSLQQQTLREFRLELELELAKLKKAAKAEEPKKVK
jgi:hypothetical protein